MTDYVYTRDAVTGQHSIIELAISLDVFGDDALNLVAWHPSCGNDELLLEVNLQSTPEPGTFVLLRSAVALLAFRRRRRRA